MEMNVGDDRNFRNALADLLKGNGGVVIGHREPHDFAAGGDHFFNLRYGRADIGGVGLGHRLNDNRRAAADLDVSNLYCFRLTHNQAARSFG